MKQSPLLFDVQQHNNQHFHPQTNLRRKLFSIVTELFSQIDGSQCTEFSKTSHTCLSDPRLPLGMTTVGSKDDRFPRSSVIASPEQASVEFIFLPHVETLT
jgi:hypothetical protein